MKIYLAGGAVRDLILGQPVSDRDYLVTHASREQFKVMHPHSKEVGHFFPIVLLDKTEFSFSEHRTIEENLDSRDLTVNALLLDKDGNLLCHPKSLEDLHTKKIRPTNLKAFLEDPLRVFRAARFWAKHPDFTPSNLLYDTMRIVAGKGLLKKIAPERIGQETIKALSAPAPGNYIRLLAQSGCLSTWFQELETVFQTQQTQTITASSHGNKALEHTCSIMDKLAGDPLLVWMACCYKLSNNSKAQPSFSKKDHHEKNNCLEAEIMARRIRLSKKFATAGLKAAQWYSTGSHYDQIGAAIKIAFLLDTHTTKTLDRLMQLIQADRKKNFVRQTHRDLKTILAISLSHGSRNLGPLSGQLLHQLRVEALAKTFSNIE